MIENPEKREGVHKYFRILEENILKHLFIRDYSNRAEEIKEQKKLK